MTARRFCETNPFTPPLGHTPGTSARRVLSQDSRFNIIHLPFTARTTPSRGRKHQRP